MLNPTQVYVEESDNDDISSIVTVDAPLSTIITSQDPPDVSSVSIGPAEISSNVQSRWVVVLSIKFRTKRLSAYLRQNLDPIFFN